MESSMTKKERIAQLEKQVAELQAAVKKMENDIFLLQMKQQSPIVYPIPITIPQTDPPEPFRTYPTWGDKTGDQIPAPYIVTCTSHL